MPVLGAGQHLIGEGAAAAHPVLHHHGLAEQRGEAIRQQPRIDIGQAARREAYDHPHGPARPARHSGTLRLRGQGNQRRNRQ